MLTTFEPKYLFFYLRGREADKPRNLKLDLEEISENALKGPDCVHTVLTKAVDIALKPYEQGEKRKTFAADYEEDIFEAGGDGELAYTHYHRGRIDQIVYRYTNPVLDLMTEATCEEDDGDEEGEENEEGDEKESEDEHPDDVADA